MPMTDLVEAITHALAQAKAPLRASDLARQIGITKQQVNSILYAHRGKRFVTSSNHAWAVIATKPTPSTRDPEANHPVSVQAYFSPNDEPLDQVCRLLDGAHRQIVVQCFYLDSQRVGTALVRACRRGVSVRVLLGRSTTSQSRVRDPELRHGGAKHPVAMALAKAGVNVYEDWGCTNNHNKVLMIDGTITITGGLNFSDFAEDNADNLVVIRSAAITRQFITDWERNCHGYGERLTPG